MAKKHNRMICECDSGYFDRYDDAYHVESCVCTLKSKNLEISSVDFTVENIQ